MTTEEKLNWLLLLWEDEYQNGQEPDIEELCQDCPELVPRLKERIYALKSTRWVAQETADSCADTLAAIGVDPSQVGEIVHLLSRLQKCGYLPNSTVHETTAQLESAGCADFESVLTWLTERGTLTEFQKSVLLRQDKSPLYLDRYILLDVLDQGGMGRIYKAVQEIMGRVVALKLLPFQNAYDRERLERFSQEIRTSAKVSHPNVVQAFDANIVNGVPFLVMEYVDGQNLKKLVENKGPLPADEAIDCIRQAALGLQHLHDQGIIHRDVKPGNLIRSNDGTVKVVDMGLASILHEWGRDDQAGGAVGTINYIAPEQRTTPFRVDHRADIYSLGCTFAYLLAGTPCVTPPHGKPRIAISSLSPAHFQLLCQMVESDCESRPGSMKEVIERLGDKPADTSLFAQASPDESTSSKSRNRRLLGLGVAMAAVLVVCLASAWMWIVDSKPDHVETVVTKRDNVETVSKNVAKRETDVEQRPAPLIGLLPEPVLAPDGNWIQVQTVQPRDALMSVCYSPDGSKFACGTANGVIRIYETEPVELVQVLTGHRAAVQALEWNPTQNVLASGSSDGSIYVWQLDTGKIRLSFEKKAGCRCLSWHKSGRHLAFATDDGGVYVYSPVLGGEKRIGSHDGIVRDVAWSSHSHYLATCGDDYVVKVWLTPEHEKPIFEYRQHQAAVHAVCWNDDDTCLSSGDASGFVRQWNHRDEEVAVWELGEPVHDLAYSSAGRLAASAGKQIWYFDSQQQEMKPIGEAGPNARIAWHPVEDSVLLCSQDQMLRIWKYGEDRVRLYFGLNQAVHGSVWSPDGKRLVTCDTQGTVSIWNRDGRREKGRDFLRPIRSAQWSPDGTKLALAGEDPELHIWNPTDDSIQHFATTASVVRAEWRPDGQWIAVAGASADVQVFHVLDSDQSYSVEHGPRGVSDLAWIDQGKRLLSVGIDNTVCVWEKDRLINRHFDVGRLGLTSVAWSENSKLIAVGELDGRLRLFTAWGTVLAELTGHKAKVHDLAFNPQGDRLTSASWDGTVRIWSATGELLSTLIKDAGTKSRFSRFYGVSWHPNGDLLSAGASDGTVRTWDIPSGKLRWLALLLHNGEYVTFDERGQVIFQSGKSDSEFVYLLQSPQEPHRLQLRTPSSYALHSE